MLNRIGRLATTTTYLLVAAVGLLGSFLLYSYLFKNGLDYYSSLSVGQACEPTRPMYHCDAVTLIHVLSDRPSGSDLKVGACDVFMYSGSAAVVGFLDFLLIYFLLLVGGLVLVALTPRGWKKKVLIAWSLVSLFVLLPLRPAIWITEFVVLAFAVWRLPMNRRARAVLIMGGTLVFLYTAGSLIVNMCNLEFFGLWRLNLPLPESSPNLQRVNSVLSGLHLGLINSAREHDDGYPYLFVALALLIKMFRRMVWFCWELWSGRSEEGAEEDFFVYFLGLPWLIAEAATPSFRVFVRSQWNRSEAVADGKTIARSLGFGSLAFTALLMLGYSPAVRVLFPNCDLTLATPAMVWGKLITMFVVQYVFLIVTQQTSIGVARMFGYGLKDNYDEPWRARNVVDFWRRWNVHWRDFLVTAVFYPTLLSLARRSGAQRGWHFMVSALLTFAVTFILTMTPIVLLSSHFSGVWRAGSDTRTSVLMLVSRAHPETVTTSLQWQRIAPSLAVYYAVEGLAVGVGLMLGWRRRSRDGGKVEAPDSRLWVVTSILLTLAFMAALRCFLDSEQDLSQQLRTLARSVGMGW